MTLSIKAIEDTRKLTTEWFTAANFLIETADDQGSFEDAYLALFAKLFKVPECDKTYRDLKRKLGIAVDETVYMVVEEDVTPPPTDVTVKEKRRTGVIHSKVVVGRDTALRQAYEYFNEAHAAFELDCEPEDVFHVRMDKDGEVRAEVGEQEVGAIPRKLLFRLLRVCSISKEVSPFEHEMEPEEPLPKKKGKPSPPIKGLRKPKPKEDWEDENKDEEEEEAGSSLEFDSELENDDDEEPEDDEP